MSRRLFHYLKLRIPSHLSLCNFFIWMLLMFPHMMRHPDTYGWTTLQVKEKKSWAGLQSAPLGLPSWNASLTKATVLEGVLFHTALGQFPSLSPSKWKQFFPIPVHSQIQKSAPYFLGKLPAEDMSANVVFLLILNGGIAVTSAGLCCQETFVTCSQ